MRKINTADEAIDGLGGTSAVARALGVDNRVVSNWRKRGLPREKFLVLGALMRRQQMKFSPALFGLETRRPRNGGAV